MSVLDSPRSTASTAAGIDPRGQRFAAAATVVVLALVLVTLPSAVAAVPLAWQLVAFAVGALVGPAHQPYGQVFRRWVRPRLGPPAELEDPAPPRFAQAVGLVFALVGLVGLLLGVTAVAYVAVAFALAAALLNAVFGFCLGCEMYLLALRLRRPATAP